MDENLILRTVGSLYLENVRLTTLLREFASKDAEISELRRQIALLSSQSIKEGIDNEHN